MVFPCREVIFSELFLLLAVAGNSSSQLASIQQAGNRAPVVSSQEPAARTKTRTTTTAASQHPKRSQKHHFLWVSEVTLGIFAVQFWGFSVLQRHGVSLRGGDFFHGVFPSGDQQQQQKPLQQQKEKVATIHSSSKKKKEPKVSFSMGFRSYVRHFSGCNFGASPSFRAMVFPCREVIFSMVFFHPGTSSKSKSLCSSRRKR